MQGEGSNSSRAGNKVVHSDTAFASEWKRSRLGNGQYSIFERNLLSRAYNSGWSYMFRTRHSITLLPSSKPNMSTCGQQLRLEEYILRWL